MSDSNDKYGLGAIGGVLGALKNRFQEGDGVPWERIKDSSTRTLKELAHVRSADDLKSTTSAFVREAEEVLDDLSAQVRSAAGSTRDSQEYKEATEALAKAAAAMRVTLNDAADTLRRTGSNVGNTLWEASPRLDSLRERLDGLLGKGQNTQHPEVIDGEVIEEERHS